jgi:hypothetical protein
MTLPQQASYPSGSGTSSKPSLLARLIKFALIALLIVLALFAIAVINNNYALHRMSRAEFSSQRYRLDRRSSRYPGQFTADVHDRRHGANVGRSPAA